MTAYDHNRMLGIFYSIFGGLIVLGSLALLAIPILAYINIPADRGHNHLAGVYYSVIVALFFLVVGLIPVTTGIGLLQHRSWARIGSIVTAIIFIASVPLGTALGVYTLIFMFSDRGRQFYLNA